MRFLSWNLSPSVLLLLFWMFMALEKVSYAAHPPEFHTNFHRHNNRLPVNDRLNEISYSFRYAIDEPAGSGVVLDHWEERQGDRVTGGYGLVEPNGQIRTVQYEVVGGQGFRAVVKTRSRNQLQFINHPPRPRQLDPHASRLLSWPQQQPLVPFQHQSLLARVL